MNKPTPGPWRKLSDYNPSMQVKTEFPYILDPEGRHVAVACEGSFTDREAQANAALIVAAVNACFAINPDSPLAVAEAMPELVDSSKWAKSILAAFLSEGSDEGREHYLPDLEHAFNRIEAALAKLEAKS